MDPLIFVDSSPSFGAPHADNASMTASAAKKPWTPIRGAGCLPGPPNHGHCIETNPSLMAAPRFGLLPLTLPARLKTSTGAPVQLRQKHLQAIEGLVPAQYNAAKIKQVACRRRSDRDPDILQSPRHGGKSTCPSFPQVARRL